MTLAAPSYQEIHLIWFQYLVSSKDTQSTKVELFDAENNSPNVNVCLQKLIISFTNKCTA